MVPLILNDSTAFWLDFEGSVFPETSKSDKKLNLEIPCFFNSEKMPRTCFFQISVSILGSVLEPRAFIFGSIRSSFFGFFLEGPFLNSGSLFLFKSMCFTTVFFRI